MKTCVVNVSTKAQRPGQDRLKAELDRQGETGFYWSTIPAGWPQHVYGYRAHALNFAAAKGYDTLLWVSSDVVPVASLWPLWDAIAAKGYWFQATASRAFIETAAFGLSMQHKRGKEFLERYLLRSVDVPCDLSKSDMWDTLISLRDLREEPYFSVGGVLSSRMLQEAPYGGSGAILLYDPLPLATIAAEPAIPPVATPTYIDRSAVNAATPGSVVPWQIGDPAWHRSLNHRAFVPVTIASEMTGHSEAPGEACYEVTFITGTDAKRFCTRAAELKIRQGWKA